MQTVRDATVRRIDVPRDIRPPDARLGWSAEPLQHWRALGSPEPAGRVSRLDRGWSTILTSLDHEPLRVRNIGADVAVGDFVVVSEDGERASSTPLDQRAQADLQ